MSPISVLITILTIYKSFVRPLLDYAYIIYDKPVNKYFKRKLETVQYDAGLVRNASIMSLV